MSKVTLKHIKVRTEDEAWDKVNEIFPTDYDKDEAASLRAGYPIYRSRVEYYNYICDLGARLEVNLGSTTINIWIDDTEARVRADLAAKTKELYPN